jgi:hypothetical protein
VTLHPIADFAADNVQQKLKMSEMRTELKITLLNYLFVYSKLFKKKNMAKQLLLMLKKM